MSIHPPPDDRHPAETHSYSLSLHELERRYNLPRPKLVREKVELMERWQNPFLRQRQVRKGPSWECW